MNAFPLRGNVSDLRHWLDNEGFTGKFIGLDAATLLNSSKDYIGAELSNDESSTLRLWCLIQAAKEERDKEGKLSKDDLTCGDSYRWALLASQASFGPLLDHFVKLFKREHKKKKYRTMCNQCLDDYFLNTSIFGHFEVCNAVTNSDKLLPGDDFKPRSRSVLLQPHKFKLPPRDSSSFAPLYRKLSIDTLPHCAVAKLGNKILVPDTLSGFEMRFLIRFIYASMGNEVPIATGSGLRLPEEGDVTTPPPPLPRPLLLLLRPDPGLLPKPKSDTRKRKRT